MGMGLPQPDFYTPCFQDSLISHIGSSYAPNNNQFGDYICLGDLWNHQESNYPWPSKEDIQSFINHPPTPTPTPTSTISSLPPNNEPSVPCFTTEDQLHSTARSELGGAGGDDLFKHVLVSEYGAASGALSQGGPIRSWSQSLPAPNIVARKQKSRKLSTTRQAITVEDLQRHFGKNRAEAAKCLEVSVPTLKRISRMFGIARWPFNKSKNRTISAEVVDESLFSPTCSSYGVFDPISSMLRESDISSPPKQLGTETVTEKEEKPMTVKVQYRDDCIKFEIFSVSKADLEGEISMRLKLKVGSFKIKYLDNDGDWILITCDVDLQLCKRSVGMEDTVNMRALPSPT